MNCKELDQLDKLIRYVVLAIKDCPEREVVAMGIKQNMVSCLMMLVSFTQVGTLESEEIEEWVEILEKTHFDLVRLRCELCGIYCTTQH